MAKTITFFFVMWLYLFFILAKKVEKCDDNITETTDGTAYWKFRGTRYTTSEDTLCWKDNWDIFLRECNTSSGKWQPENVVCKAHGKINMYCPDELVEIYNEKGDPLCLKISTKAHKYDDNFCHGSNIILPFDFSKLKTSNFSQFLYAQGLWEYWLPIRRENSYTPFKIRLPGEHWAQVVDVNLKFLDLRSDKKCMSARHSYREQQNSEKSRSSELVLKITDCEDELHSICVFHGNLIATSGCPKGLGALSYRPHECYGVNWENRLSNDQKEVRIKEYFQKRNTFRLVLKKFLPKEKQKNFFQVDNFVDRFGDKYVILMNRNEVVRVVNIEKMNKIPILYKQTINNHVNTVQLILKFDSTLQELILIVYNDKYLWRINKNDNGVQCFTNADFDLQRSVKIDIIWKNKNSAKSIFKVELVGDGPGEYWCEGHSIFDFHHVTTQRIVATKKRQGHSFAVRINITCLIFDKNVYTNMCYNIWKNTKKLSNNVLQVLRNKSNEVSQDLILHSSRIMSIEEITTEHVDCWIHLTASQRYSAVDNSEEESSEEDNSLETGNHIRHDTSVRMQIWTMLQELISIHSSKSTNIVRSTEYCFPNTFRLDDNKIYQVKQASIGQLGLLSRLCLQNNGMPYTLHCCGNFLHGAYWESLNKNTTCHINENMKITKTLYNLESSNMIQTLPEEVVRNLKNILKKYAKQLIPADIHFAANIVQSSVKKLNQYILSYPKNLTVADNRRGHALFKETIWDLIYIYNYLIDVKENTIMMSAKLNSTNKLLEAFENAMNTVSSQIISDNILSRTVGNSSEFEPTDFEVLDYEDIGVSVRISPNLLYFIINPSTANISGIALFKNDNTTELPYILKGAFQHEHYRFLQSNHEIDDFLYEPNLQLGTYIPDNLLKQLSSIPNAQNDTSKTNTILVIKVYSNDKLFQSQAHHTPQAALGRIVSISLPGHSTHLPEDLPIAFRLWKNGVKRNKTTEMCSYWNFKNWASDGVQVSSLSDLYNDIVLCQVSHLTPFAYLVGFNFTVDEEIEVNIRRIHDQALDIITLTGCSLSLLGISGIFITAAIFNSWRQKPSSKVLLQLSAAIAIQMIILCFVSTEEYSLHLIINNILPSCVAIGAFLHYSVLVQFFWMMVIAYLQFKRYVQVFGGSRPKRFFIKSTAFCWGVPVIPVALVIVLDHNSFSKGPICYPSGYALYFGIIMPILIIVFANFIIFCLILYNILVKSSIPIRHTDKPMLIYQIRLSVLLFFLLGFTWCFGFLSTTKSGIVFSYLFCLTATLQGFVIFIYFIILDPVTRRMWGKLFCKFCSNDKSIFQSTDIARDTTQTN